MFKVKVTWKVQIVNERLFGHSSEHPNIRQSDTTVAVTSEHSVHGALGRVT